MSTLRQEEAVGAGLRRIACERVEAGVRALTRQADPAQASSAMREAAAVLELIDPGLPRTRARRDRGLIERVLTGLDEIQQPTRLLSRLNAHYKKSPGDAELTGAVKSLRKQWSGSGKPASALNSPGGSFDPAIYRLVADMAELRGHVGDWPTNTIDGQAPPPGLRRTYARARRLTGQPMDTDALDLFAEALDTLANQLGLLSKPCPPMVKAQRKLLRRAADAIHDHVADLRLDQALRGQLKKKSGSLLPDPDAINTRLNEALTQYAQPALAETPAAFHNRLNAYWSAWRGGQS